MLINKLTHIGLQYAQSLSERRSILLSNAVSMILATLGFILSALYLTLYGWSVITAMIPVISLLSLTTLAFNHFNYSLLARLWISLFLPLATMTLSIYSKTIYYATQEELDYFTFRIIILSCCVLPPVFFSLQEKKYLIISCISILVILQLHDPLHAFFDVPYIQRTLSESNYAFTNIILLMMCLLMTGAVIFMKGISEKNEAKALVLIEELHQTNKMLQHKNAEIKLQNREILTQSDHLSISQRKLKEAYNIIEEQRNLLYAKNKHLSAELIEKNKALTETNNELIKHNNELRQFSYTVSHNLRGPVASLMGLLKLIDVHQFSKAHAEIFSHIETSTQRLDNIIKDLSKIIDIRHDIFQIRQKINLPHEITEILQVLNKEILSHNITIETDLDQCPVFYSIRPMIHSILYNLISNAVKYRSSDRVSRVTITSMEELKYYILEVRDNGLGIDLERDKENLFKLYKRFHHHTEGKGLGLYLVKLQTEALGGTIEVASKVDQFTSFTVKLRKPENAERQVLYHNNCAEIFFDAKLNCIETTWACPVTHDQSYIVFEKLLEFIKFYNTPSYITDFIVDDSMDDQHPYLTFVETIAEASKNGLKRIGVIPKSTATSSFPEPVLQHLSKMGATIATFASQQEAFEWIQKENEYTTLNSAG